MSIPQAQCVTGKYCYPAPGDSIQMANQYIMLWNPYYNPFFVQKIVDIYFYDTYDTRTPVASFLNINNGDGSFGFEPNYSWFVYAPNDQPAQRSFAFSIVPHGSDPIPPDSGSFFIFATLTPTNPNSNPDPTVTSIITINDNSSRLSNGAIIAISICSFILLVLIIFALLLIRRRKSRAASDREGNLPDYPKDKTQNDSTFPSQNSDSPLLYPAAGPARFASDSNLEAPHYYNFERSASIDNPAHLFNPIIMDSPKAIALGIRNSTRTNSLSSYSHNASAPDLHEENVDINRIKKELLNVMDKAPVEDLGDPNPEFHNFNHSAKLETWREEAAQERLNRTLAEENSVLHSAQHKSKESDPDLQS
ncbi:hypothetical protein BB560_000479 [Smittium megazygosporum]|uniref:Uncharacterized protein n=1 Tax=Smittium megazygosporum TaxID=133381 RepID=A0A2T9ZKA0_9FUNG|nr:hypothetical protein BB560_000479 [Smittium megazygosporum]